MARMISEQEVRRCCRFCNPPDNDRVVYQTDNFYVMLSLGPIVEGYLLIISKEHYECCAGLPTTRFKEFFTLLYQVKYILKKEYGSVILYEHGRSGCLQDHSSGTHCFHAHLHCVPVNIDLGKIVQNDFEYLPIADWEELRQWYQKQCLRYLFIEVEDMKKVFPIFQSIRSQYLRFKLANALNLEKTADWLKFPQWRKVAAGRKRLLPHFQTFG